MVKSILKSFGLSKAQSNPREEIQDIISEEGQKEEAFDAHEKILLKNILGLMGYNFCRYNGATCRHSCCRY